MKKLIITYPTCDMSEPLHDLSGLLSDGNQRCWHSNPRSSLTQFFTPETYYKTFISLFALSLTSVSAGGSVSDTTASPPRSPSSTATLKQKTDKIASLSLSASLLACAVGGWAACETQFKLRLVFFSYSVSPSHFLPSRSNTISIKSHTLAFRNFTKGYVSGMYITKITLY